MCEVIYELTPPYSAESNGIAEYFIQTINLIVHSMTIAAPDFPCLWGKAIKIGAYLKNRLQHQHLLSLTILFDRFHRKRPIILPLKPFGNMCDVYIREEEQSPGCKHPPCARKAIIVGYTLLLNFIEYSP
jgi:hypothetical protein